MGSTGTTNNTSTHNTQNVPKYFTIQTKPHPLSGTVPTSNSFSLTKNIAVSKQLRPQVGVPSLISSPDTADVMVSTAGLPIPLPTTPPCGTVQVLNLAARNDTDIKSHQPQSDVLIVPESLSLASTSTHKISVNDDDEASSRSSTSSISPNGN